MFLDLGQPTVDNSTNILDVEIPPQLEQNVPTGHPQIDALFAGDGITPSTAALVTGIAGSGKTTLMLQLADAITSMGHIALYNTNEESLFQIRRVCKRLNLKNGFIPAYESTAQGILKKANQVQKMYPESQVFLFVDSLQTVDLEEDKSQPAKRGRPKGRQAEIEEALGMITKWCKDTYGIALVIGQVTKDGTFAGKSTLKHYVDAHFHMSVDKDRKSPDYGSRTAGMEKNRFGIAGIQMRYSVGANGVVFDVL